MTDPQTRTLVADAPELLSETEIEMPDGKMGTLADCALDITEAHEELSQYKSGALALTQALDERLIEAEQAGDEEVASALKELKHAAYGVYVRLNRGDDEAFGDRDGDYAGYFEDDGSE